MSDSEKTVKVYEGEVVAQSAMTGNNLYVGPPGRYVREEDFRRALDLVAAAYKEGWMYAAPEELEDAWSRSYTATLLRAMKGE